MNSPPGLKLGVVTPKESGVVIKRWAQCLFFFADFFFAAFFLFFAIDYSPLSIRNVRRGVKSWE